MSLPPELWAALRLEGDVVRARAAFFTAYARRESLFDANILVQALQDGPIATGHGAVVSLSSSETVGPVAKLRQKIDEVGDRPQYPPWVDVAERADALRQAALAELLYDTQAGIRTLLRSAEEYLRLGLPFGAFLRAACTEAEGDAFTAGQRLGFILNPQIPIEPHEEGMISLEDALRAPAQQVAALLTAMSLTDAIYEFRTIIETLPAAAQSASSAPIGTTAQPLAIWWECGHRLFELALGRAEAREDFRILVMAIAAAHGNQLRNAQYDGYHWSAAAARVDLVDLDLAGLVAISARLLRQLREPSWDMPQDFGGLPFLSQISIQVGLNIADAGGEQSDLFDPDPRPHPGPGIGRQATSTRGQDFYS